jgi:hypothetical protein
MGIGVEGRGKEYGSIGIVRGKGVNIAHGVYLDCRN